MTFIQTRSSVRVIRQENAGDSAARNTGLENACGSFVQFLDHDDILFPEALTKHSTALEARPDIDMVFGSNIQISEKGTKLADNLQPAREFSGRDVAMGTTPSFSQCLYRKSALDRIGGFRPEALNAADHDLNIRLLGDRKSGYCHGEMVMAYRKHQGQQTRSPSKLFVNHMRVLGWHFGPGGFLEDKNYLPQLLRHWKGYYGKAMPGELIRHLRNGDLPSAAGVFSIFLRAQPQASLEALRYLPQRLMKLRT